jgi:hypothetical protein
MDQLARLVAAVFRLIAVLRRGRSLHPVGPGSMRAAWPFGCPTPTGPAAAEALRFNPWTTGPGIRPVGRLNRLRRPSYPG